MLILSFRDLAAASAGAVTPAVMVELHGVRDGFDWNAPGSLRRRLADGGARYLDWETVRQRLADRSVCFVVHGFNVNRDRGYPGYGAMAQQLSGLGPLLPGLPARLGAIAECDLVIPVLWPGDWHLPGVNYPFEMGDVYKTGEQFAVFLVSDAARLSSVSFASHSLGARVVLETMSRALAHRRADAAPRFDAAILMAAAADEDILDDPRYARAVQALGRIIVVSSAKDSVLGDIFPTGDAVEAALWSQEKASKRALGFFGPKALKPGSAATGKVQWFAIDRGEDCGHDGYFPWPWKTDIKPDGWTAQRAKVAGFLHKAFAGGPPPFTPGWPVDMRFGG